MINSFHLEGIARLQVHCEARANMTVRIICIVQPPNSRLASFSTKSLSVFTAKYPTTERHPSQHKKTPRAQASSCSYTGDIPQRFLKHQFARHSSLKAHPTPSSRSHCRATSHDAGRHHFIEQKKLGLRIAPNGGQILAQALT